MECVCGYSFTSTSSESPRPFENFALIDDRHYKKFLQAELKAVESGELPDILKAARYVGNLRVCPDCGVVSISWPDSEKPYTYLTPVKKVESKGVEP